jgi:hypothetical protein
MFSGNLSVAGCASLNRNGCKVQRVSIYWREKRDADWDRPSKYGVDRTRYDRYHVLQIRLSRTLPMVLTSVSGVAQTLGGVDDVAQTIEWTCQRPI